MESRNKARKVNEMVPVKKKSLEEWEQDLNKTTLFKLVFPYIMFNFEDFYRHCDLSRVLELLGSAQSMACTCRALAGYERLKKFINDLKMVREQPYSFKVLLYERKHFLMFRRTNKIVFSDFANLIYFINTYCHKPLPVSIEVNVAWKLPGVDHTKKHYILLDENFPSFKKTTLIGRLKYMGETSPIDQKFYLIGNFHTAYSWFLHCMENSRKKSTINDRLELFVKTWFTRWPWESDQKISNNKILFAF